MKKYRRSEIRFNITNIIDYTISNESCNKYSCQVFTNDIKSDFVCLLTGDSYEEVNNKFEKMNKER